MIAKETMILFSIKCLKRLFNRFYKEGPRIRLQLRNTVYFKFFLTIFDPYGRYGRFHGVKDRSNRAVNVTVGPFWTDPLHHKIDRSGHKNGKI